MNKRLVKTYSRYLDLPKNLLAELSGPSFYTSSTVTTDRELGYLGFKSP